MSVLGLFDKHDPRDKLDYTIRWVDWLNGDQITGSTWAAASDNPAGMIMDSDSFTTGTTTLWLASGTIGSSYRFDNQIATLAGREKNESIIVSVKDR